MVIAILNRNTIFALCRSILSLSCWPRFLGVGAFSFKRSLLVFESLISPISQIYDCF
nr:MAG TPA: hypothetical protein [Caudoviricetes sp.]